jgi:hypothetical protein
MEIEGMPARGQKKYIGEFQRRQAQAGNELETLTVGQPWATALFRGW